MNQLFSSNSNGKKQRNVRFKHVNSTACDKKTENWQRPNRSNINQTETHRWNLNPQIKIDRIVFSPLKSNLSRTELHLEFLRVGEIDERIDIRRMIFPSSSSERKRQFDEVYLVLRNWMIDLAGERLWEKLRKRRDRERNRVGGSCRGVILCSRVL